MQKAAAAGQTLSSRQKEAEENPTNPEYEHDFKKAYHMVRVCAIE
jgi:hypothetical protein